MVIIIYNSVLSRDIIQTKIIRHLAIQERQGEINNKDIIFVIPSYNESLIAVDTVKKIQKAGYGIIFVDDGSKNDEAYQTLKNAVVNTAPRSTTGTQLENVVCIQHPINL